MPEEECKSERILQLLESSLMKDLHLIGIPEIAKVFVQEAKIKTFDPDTGALMDKKEEWEILTDGTNMSEVFLIDKVDFRRVTSNDINEIYENLGIEAVRGALLIELRKVLNPYGIYVNYRHLACLCDVMTQTGLLTSITRHGINRVEHGPLRKSSFEETVEILLEAGIYAEVDQLKGISENIMLGQLAPFGTGCFDLILDLDKIENAPYIEDFRQEIDDSNNIMTPINSGGHSPIISTPFVNATPRAGLGVSFTPMTAARHTPSFTPNRYDSKKYSYNLDSQPDVVVTTIISPYNNPSAVASPLYQMDPPYSPKKDDSSISNKTKGMRSLDSSTHYSQPVHTPYIQHYSSYHSSPTYSPGLPVTASERRIGMSPSYPSYNLHSSNYSPTTPVNHRGASPNYYSARSSSYSVANSPQVSHSPNSPTYNPKSPSYMMSNSSKFQCF